MAGCLRNAAAVAEWVSSVGGAVTVIPAGERWPDRSLRHAFEDMAGAGAIIRELPGLHSPEAQAAVAVFEEAESQLAVKMLACSSGLELMSRGFPEDVELAAQLNVSQTVPVLEGDAFTGGQTGN